MLYKSIHELLDSAKLKYIQDENIKGGIKVGDFYKNLNNIPESYGIYFVVFDKSKTINITKNCEIHKIKNVVTNADKTRYSKDSLNAKLDLYKKDSNILYIGKAEVKSGGLRKRLKQYIDTYKNKHGRHNGGKAVWQLNDPDSLIIYYIEEKFLGDSRSSAIESRLLVEFLGIYNTYPLANWKK